MMKIHKTTNYEIFELHEFNRDIGSTKKLEMSMLKYGWIDAYPMHVVKKDNGVLSIKAGHHRFTVARKLKIPIKYVVCENDEITIHELETSTNTWKLEDYLKSYIRLGCNDYILVDKYREKTGYPLSVCIDLCSGHTVCNNNQGKKFKSGTYKIGDTKHANIMSQTTGELKKLGIEFYAKRSFLKALSMCILVPDFSTKTFVNKSKTNAGIMQRQSNVENYLNMIEKIYNKGSKKNAIPLAFLANEISKKRNPIKK